jgi:hypothetical protein
MVVQDKAIHDLPFFGFMNLVCRHIIGFPERGIDLSQTFDLYNTNEDRKKSHIHVPGGI